MANITQDVMVYPYTTVANKYGKTWHLPTCPTLKQAKYVRGCKVGMDEYNRIQREKGNPYGLSGNRECKTCLGQREVGVDLSQAELMQVFLQAHTAGHKAAMECIPEPMIVEQHKDMLDDDSPVVRQYHVPEGVCGFAWVTIRPGNSKAAHYAKTKLDARVGYYGGMEVWVHTYGQSYQRKVAYAHAFAAILRAAGIDATSGSRLD